MALPRSDMTSAGLEKAQPQDLKKLICVSIPMLKMLHFGFSNCRQILVSQASP